MFESEKSFDLLTSGFVVRRLTNYTHKRLLLAVACVEMINLYKTALVNTECAHFSIHVTTQSFQLLKPTLMSFYICIAWRSEEMVEYFKRNYVKHKRIEGLNLFAICDCTVYWLLGMFIGENVQFSFWKDPVKPFKHSTLVLFHSDVITGIKGCLHYKPVMVFVLSFTCINEFFLEMDIPRNDAGA